MLKPIYKRLFDAQSIAGHESSVRKIMRTELKKHTSFDIRTDNLGSVFGVKEASVENPFVVMVAGHMDEVGLIVSGITEDGMLKIQPLGGLSGEVLISQVMDVHGANGIVKGIIGAIPPHLKKSQNTDVAQMRLDIGARSLEEAHAFGVRTGDMVAFQNPFSVSKNGRRVIAKAIDNRYGCGLALEAAARYDKKELPYTLVTGATVQEEVGLRGAETSVNTFGPDLFIALDASPVNDVLDKTSLGKLGEGFLLRIHDPRNVIHQGLLRLIVKVAERKRIKFQYFTSLGGTDAAKALDMADGIPATTIGLPARYIHSSAAMMDLEDLASARQMLFSLLDTLTPEIIRSLKEGTL
jgi:glutamyl aminopeptidase